MSEYTLHEEATAATLAGTDLYPVMQSKALKNATLTQLANALNGGGVVPTVAAATTTANLANSGISTLSSSTIQYTLAAPVAGVEKIITSLILSTGARSVTAGTGVTFDGVNNVWTSTGQDQSLTLIGLSSTRWNIVALNSTTTSLGALSTA